MTDNSKTKRNLEMLYDTMEILNRGSYEKEGREVKLRLDRSRMENILVLLPEKLKDPEKYMPLKMEQGKGKCRRECVNMDSFEAARMIMAESQSIAEPGSGLKTADKVLVLNFANAYHPGGGVRKGSVAQEEDLCRRSSLLLSLESLNAGEYYKYNAVNKRFGPDLGSDAIMITPDVEIIKNKNGELLTETAVVSVMTCAAPNFNDPREAAGLPDYESMMYRRIYNMLKLAAHMGYRKLVLGAFGCGAFHNDPVRVSDIFRDVLNDFSYYGVDLDQAFDRICFAVMVSRKNTANFDAFSKNFGGSDRNIDEAGKPVFFWHEYGENGWLSNWYRSEFEYDGFIYFCMEQYLMAQKALLFNDSRMYTAILRADDPAECKRLGRAVKPFDPETWKAALPGILEAGLWNKFIQNPELEARLMATEDRLLAEASPSDRLYGIGLTAEAAAESDPAEWPGKNILGKALMLVRKELRELRLEEKLNR